jgi:hypothetical protein
MKCSSKASETSNSDRSNLDFYSEYDIAKQQIAAVVSAVEQVICARIAIWGFNRRVLSTKWPWCDQLCACPQKPIQSDGVVLVLTKADMTCPIIAVEVESKRCNQGFAYIKDVFAGIATLQASRSGALVLMDSKGFGCYKPFRRDPADLVPNPMSSRIGYKGFSANFSNAVPRSGGKPGFEFVETVGDEDSFASESATSLPPTSRSGENVFSPARTRSSSKASAAGSSKSSLAPPVQATVSDPNVVMSPPKGSISATSSQSSFTLNKTTGKDQKGRRSSPTAQFQKVLLNTFEFLMSRVVEVTLMKEELGVTIDQFSSEGWKPSESNEQHVNDQNVTPPCSFFGATAKIRKNEFLKSKAYKGLHAQVKEKYAKVEKLDTSFAAASQPADLDETVNADHQFSAEDPVEDLVDDEEEKVVEAKELSSGEGEIETKLHYIHRDPGYQALGDTLSWEDQIPVRVASKETKKGNVPIHCATPSQHYEDGQLTCQNYTSVRDFVQRGFEEFITINGIELDETFKATGPRNLPPPPPENFQVHPRHFYSSNSDDVNPLNPSSGTQSAPIKSNLHKRTYQKGNYLWIRKSLRCEWRYDWSNQKTLLMTWDGVQPPKLNNLRRFTAIGKKQ